MLKIHRASDPIEVSQIKIVLYGQPGAYKTSVAFTTEAPLLLDFDGGAQRSAYRQDHVPIASWGDVTSITADDLAPYKTLVIDTVGRALDFLGASLIAQNPKLARATGEMSLQGYGALKGAFAQWISRINTLGLDVVMIAHDKESTNERDVKIVRPDITGGTYHEIFKLADSVGYIYLTDGKKHVLDFSPTENYVGKNPAQFDVIEIPHNMPSDFGAGLIARVKAALGSISAEGQKVVNAVNEFRELIEQIETPEQMTGLLGKVNEFTEPLKAQAKTLMNERSKALGFEFDKKAKAFKAKEAEAA